MCLTGLDYFSTLGYQPGIAFLAGGLLSPIATLFIVILTLFGALPIYKEVAKQSPHGQGSITIIEKLFPGWRSKSSVLILLGFATTDFIITITLSAADATAHIIENPFVGHVLNHKILITLAIIAILCFIFLKGFQEAITTAIIVVFSYLILNFVIVIRTFYEIIQNSNSIPLYFENLLKLHHNNVFLILGLSALLFPKLALGLSGFETGVTVMPLIKGDTQEKHIKNTFKLLITAAIIMSFFLIMSSFITTILIEPDKFQAGGEANGRALAYLAHKYLGHIFGSIYDISTICILGLAGASAMAGLLNLIPRYLPIYGMAPDWAKQRRPLTLVITLISFLVTLIFSAEVDAQAGAYATGVLVLISSAAIAVTISLWKQKKAFLYLLISIIFSYTTIANIFERPEGFKISVCFIALIIIISLISRIYRSTELRIDPVIFDKKALEFLKNDKDQIIRLIAHRPRYGTIEEYNIKDYLARKRHNLTDNEQLIFIEIERSDPSQFDSSLEVFGQTIGKHSILKAKSPAVANAVAALLLKIQKITKKTPHIYFGWTEGSPVACAFKYIFWGEGDVAPTTREILRREIKDDENRPFVHVS